MSSSLDVAPTTAHPIDELNAWIDLGHASQAPAMVAPDGTLTGAAAHLLTPDPALARALYRDMVLGRRLDQEATALQRQGELCMWIPSLGQEGAQAGAIRAVRDSDMVFPTYREHTAAIARQVPVGEFLHMFRGVGHGGWDSHKHQFQIYTVVLAAQLLHAVGYGMGIQRDGADEVVLACIGDGATSQGDANEAFGWAAAQSVPVVFFSCRTTNTRSPCRYGRSPRSRWLGAPTASGSPDFGSTATIRSRGARCRTHRGRLRSYGRRPGVDRGRHLPPRPAHHRGRPAPLPRLHRGVLLGRSRPAEPDPYFPAGPGMGGRRLALHSGQ
nr:thiamine pyrophosphate-dependent enzyme [Fodinicola feengrottensis]